jgi:hypothetical protein
MDLLSFPDNSRVWIYGADQKIPDHLVNSIHEKIVSFTREWSSHQQALKATGGLLHNYFVVFVVDDGYNKPGGCSIDSSVRFIKSLEKEFDLDFFNRNIFYYIDKETVKAISRSEMSKAIDEGIINEDSLFFDTLVQTKSDFQNQWLKPLKYSWHAKLI